MDDFMLRTFQSEVALQCRFILLGEAQLEQLDRDEEEALARGRKIYEDAKAKRDAAVEARDLDEVVRQQRRMREAWRPDSRDTTYRTWFALQGILASAANLSKLLWGSDDPRMTQAKRDQREAERKALRDSLGVTDESPLKSRRVRNAFEHFDERLEDRLRDPTKRRVYIGRNIGGHSPEATSEEMFGHYFRDDGIVVFWDKSISVPELVAAARNLLPVAESESRRFGGGG